MTKNRELQPKKNPKTKTFIFIVIIIIFILFGLYIFTLKNKKNNNEAMIKIGSGSILTSYVGGANIVAEKVTPSSNPIVTKKIIIVGNNKTNAANPMRYNIYLIVEKNTFSEGTLSYTLTSTNEYKTGTIIPSIVEKQPIKNDTVLLKNGNQDHGEFLSGKKMVHTYVINIYFSESENSSTDILEGIFEARVLVSETGDEALIVGEGNCPKDSEAFLNSPNPIKRGNIETITFETTNVVPDDVLGSWNVTQDGRIKGWYNAGKTKNMYEVHIGSKGGVKANADSSFLFAGMSNIKSIDFKNFDESTAEDMAGMFYETGKLSSTFTLGDISTWDVSKVKDMSYMFKNTGYSSSNFSLGDISDWNVTKVEDMSHMFDGIGKANRNMILNLSNWNVTNVVDMNSMFANTMGLTSLRLDKWNIPEAVNDDFFSNSNTREKPNNLKIYVKNVAMESWIRGNESLPSNAELKIV